MRRTGSIPVAVAVIVMVSVSNGFAQQIQLNAQKYRERNPSAAIGRSGSATLAARLLLAKDGTTDAEVTTKGDHR